MHRKRGLLHLADSQVLPICWVQILHSNYVPSVFNINLWQTPVYSNKLKRMYFHEEFSIIHIRLLDRMKAKWTDTVFIQLVHQTFVNGIHKGSWHHNKQCNRQVGSQLQQSVSRCCLWTTGFNIMTVFCPAVAVTLYSDTVVFHNRKHKIIIKKKKIYFCSRAVIISLADIIKVKSGSDMAPKIKKIIFCSTSSLAPWLQIYTLHKITSKS